MSKADGPCYSILLAKLHDFVLECCHKRENLRSKRNKSIKEAFQYAEAFRVPSWFGVLAKRISLKIIGKCFYLIFTVIAELKTFDNGKAKGRGSSIVTPLLSNLLSAIADKSNQNNSCCS
jgi:hypothetical protein